MKNEHEVKSAIIENLKNEIEKGNLKELDKFWDKVEKQGAPLLEEIKGNESERLLTFLYRGNENTENVVIIGSFPGYRFKENTMEKLLNTDLWYKSYVIRNDVKFKYRFSVNDTLEEKWERRSKNMIVDSLNSKTFIRVKDEDKEDDEEVIESVFEMPLVKEEKWVKERSDIKKGKFELVRFNSSTLGGSRRVWIYTPSGYGKDNSTYDLLVLTDGFFYKNTLSAPNVFDNLINDKKVEPFVAVLIDTYGDHRYKELTCSDSMSQFISYELMNWVRKNYNVTTDSTKTTIGGLSLGGLMASYVGLKHSEIFGNVLSQSGSYWYKPDDYEKDNWVSDQFENTHKLPLKFYLNIGVLEPKEAIIDTNIVFRDTLKKKGYEVHFEWFQSGHDSLSWGETLANGLIALRSK